MEQQKNQGKNLMLSSGMKPTDPYVKASSPGFQRAGDGRHARSGTAYGRYAGMTLTASLRYVSVDTAIYSLN